MKIKKAAPPTTERNRLELQDNNNQNSTIKQAVNPISCACIGPQIESLKLDLVNLRQGAADILACFAEIRLRTEARP
jgi:hypothetical protein